MAVTSPTPPQVPVVPKVEMAPTHGGGQTETIGGNAGKTGTSTENASGENTQKQNSFGTRTNETQQGKASDGAGQAQQKNQPPQQKDTDSAENAEIPQVQFPAASVETETQTTQQTAIPPYGEKSVIETYWPFLLVFAAALIYFLYRNYQKSHTLEIKQPTTLRELLEQEERDGKKEESSRGNSLEESTEEFVQEHIIEASEGVSRQRQAQGYAAARPVDSKSSDTPPEKPQVKKSDGHIEIRI